MHPADLADIVEELSHAEREAIFESIDSEAAADALTEVDPKMQANILESLEPEKAAEIVEEMDPDEAADALAELEDETSEEILDEMESADKTEVQELLEFEEDTAGGMMNTQFVALPEDALTGDAAAAIEAAEELLETLNTLFLVDARAGPPRRFRWPASSSRGPEPVSRISPRRRCITAPVDEAQHRITEQFDKYNLLTLPVVDEEGKLAGVITADDIISVLRNG